MAAEYVDVVGKAGVAALDILEHFGGSLPGADLLTGNYLNLGVVVGAVGFGFQVLGEVLHPVVVTAALVLGRGNIVELNAVGGVRRVQGFLVPLVACRVHVLGAADPQRFAPPEHIQREVRVDGFRVRSQLVSGAAGHVRRLVLGALDGGLGTGGGVHIGAHFQFEVRYLQPLPAEHVVHDLPVRLGILRLVVQQKPRGVVSADHSHAAVEHVFKGVGIVAVYNYVHGICLLFCRRRQYKRVRRSRRAYRSCRYLPEFHYNAPFRYASL